MVQGEILLRDTKKHQTLFCLYLYKFLFGIYAWLIQTRTILILIGPK